MYKSLESSVLTTRAAVSCHAIPKKPYITPITVASLFATAYIPAAAKSKKLIIMILSAIDIITSAILLGIRGKEYNTISLIFANL